MLAPAADRSAVDRLAHLIDAGGADRPLGAVEFKAGGVPGQPEERDHPPRLTVEIVDHRLVFDLEKWVGGSVARQCAISAS